MAVGRGRFITIEGIEGAGKSTQVRLLADALTAAGVAVLVTREPGGSPEAEAIRRLLLQGAMHRWSPLTEALLHYAARREHLDHVVLPAVDGGRWVISDRFADSTMAYQGYGQNLGPRRVADLHRLVVGELAPDLTLILDLPVEVGLARAQERSPGGDRYERMDVSFHRRVREGFLEIARRARERCVVVDATPPPAEVQRAIRSVVAGRLGVAL